MKTYKFYLPGSILILMAIAIVMFPALLVIIFSSLLAGSGMFALFAGHRLRKQFFTNDQIFNVWFNKEYFSNPAYRSSGKEGVIYH